MGLVCVPYELLGTVRVQGRKTEARTGLYEELRTADGGPRVLEATQGRSSPALDAPSLFDQTAPTFPASEPLGDRLA